MVDGPRIFTRRDKWTATSRRQDTSQRERESPGGTVTDSDQHSAYTRHQNAVTQRRRRLHLLVYYNWQYHGFTLEDKFHYLTMEGLHKPDIAAARGNLKGWLTFRFPANSRNWDKPDAKGFVSIPTIRTKIPEIIRTTDECCGTRSQLMIFWGWERLIICIERSSTREFSEEAPWKPRLHPTWYSVSIIKHWNRLPELQFGL